MQHPMTTDEMLATSQRYGPAPPSNTSASDPRPPAPKKRRRIWWAVAAIVGVIAIAGAAFLAGRNSAPASETVAGTAVPATVSAQETPPTTTATTEPVQEPVLEAELFDASAIGEAAIPSVVTVLVNGDGFGSASGSGVIYDDSGHIVTNHHVIENGGNYRVILSDGRLYEAELVGTNPATDLAVLAIEAENVEPIDIGDTSGLRVGDPAVAVGSPLGLEGGPSLTVGVLSAFGREVQTDPATRLFGMLQTDAPITQGSSGGALVDEQGRLIGITTAVGVSSVGIEGIGFATPVEIVTRVADEIIATGDATEPFLGITGITAFDSIADGGERPVGVSVESVQPGSAADDAGLVAGDVITSLAGEPIDTMDELVAALRRFRAGEIIDMTVLDASGAERSISVSLGDR